MEKNCSQTNGNRYILNGDRAVMLIFNANGNIAGIGAAVPKNCKENLFSYPSNRQIFLFSIKKRGKLYLKRLVSNLGVLKTIFYLF